jgi:hypothetical protein
VRLEVSLEGLAIVVVEAASRGKNPGGAIVSVSQRHIVKSV